MRPEKKYLAAEVENYFDKTNYVFLADYRKVSVPDTIGLKDSLRKEEAEYHVVKNSILNLVAKSKNAPDLKEFLQGQTAIVFGGKNPTGVAKCLIEFSKEKEKLSVKGGFLDGKLLSADDIQMLAKLPSLDVLRGQLLNLLQKPAQQLLSVMQGVPCGLLNVLNAHSEK